VNRLFLSRLRRSHVALHKPAVAESKASHRDELPAVLRSRTPAEGLDRSLRHTLAIGRRDTALDEKKKGAVSRALPVLYVCCD
jgi:hypothetical protein